jgi:hypothetical protein
MNIAAVNVNVVPSLPLGLSRNDTRMTTVMVLIALFIYLSTVTGVKSHDYRYQLYHHLF